jgi:glycosyltransferase involved in cell wall biosynthesis
LLALMNRMMASLLARAARRIYVSTSAWEPLLRKIAPGSMVRALPAPSNLPTVAEEGRMSQIRLRFGPRAHLIGHFGTYSPSVTSLLVPLVPVLLAPDHARQVLLLGRGNCAFAERLLANFPHFSGRIHAIGDVSDDELVAHLAACDLLVQPYSDGVTTRRTTVMSGLALGVPILTTSGKLTEPFWAACGGVALVDVDDLALGGAAVVNSLLGDDSRRRQLGERGRALYRERFAIEHTIAALRAAN